MGLVILIGSPFEKKPRPEREGEQGYRESTSPFDRDEPLAPYQRGLEKEDERQFKLERNLERGAPRLRLSRSMKR
jgi:hypothetical protein